MRQKPVPFRDRLLSLWRGRSGGFGRFAESFRRNHSVCPRRSLRLVWEHTLSKQVMNSILSPVGRDISRSPCRELPKILDNRRTDSVTMVHWRRHLCGILREKHRSVVCGRRQEAILPRRGRLNAENMGKRAALDTGTEDSVPGQRSGGARRMSRETTAGSTGQNEGDEHVE